LGAAAPGGSYLPNPGMSKLGYFALKYSVEVIFKLVYAHFLKPLMRVIRENGEDIKYKEFLNKSTYIIPEPDFYLPPVNKEPDFINVGPLSWSGFEKSRPDWLDKINPDGKTIYLTFGGTGFSKEKFIELADRLTKKNFRVVVSTGTIANPEDFPKHENLFVARYLPGKEACRRVDVVVCHGGYCTSIEAIGQNKPVLAITFNPDQIVHGWRLQELGVAKSLIRIKFFDLLGIFSFDWKKLENKTKKIEVDQIIKELEKMLENMDGYKKALARFNELYPPIDGAKQVADIVSK
jgi:UDP:flavonoid glycosyltransferase YjiC (YdhE family)